MIKSGYIKTVRIKKPVEGMHVYWTGCPSKVKTWIVREIKNKIATISPNINSPRAQTPDVSELRNLVIEFKDYFPTAPNLKEKVLLDPSNNLYYQIKHIQLGFVDWRKAIKYDLIDTDKEIRFDTHDESYGDIYIQEATIAIFPPATDSPQIFTEEDMLKAFEAGEYKMEYPKTAQGFDMFIRILKNIKLAAENVN